MSEKQTHTLCIFAKDWACYRAEQSISLPNELAKWLLLEGILRDAWREFEAVR